MALGINIKVQKMCKDVELPVYKTAGAVGMDVKAYVGSIPIRILPRNVAIIPTGLKMEIPEGYEVQVRSRSGLASQGVFVINSPGTIDSDYRGEVKVLLYNATDFPVIVKHGDRVAQLVVKPVYRVTLESVKELSDTDRGEGGFGHTGR